jgi:hypothetical protein
MSTEQREIFRDTILQALNRMPGGMSLATLRVILKSCGFTRFAEEDVEAGLQYFIDKQFVAPVPKSHSLGLKVWRITAAGVDDLESRDL